MIEYTEQTIIMISAQNVLKLLAASEMLQVTINVIVTTAVQWSSGMFASDRVRSSWNDVFQMSQLKERIEIYLSDRVVSIEDIKQHFGIADKYNCSNLKVFIHYSMKWPTFVQTQLHDGWFDYPLW